DAVGQPQPNPDGYLDVFFAKSPSSRQAGQQTLQRIFGRTNDPDQQTTWQTRLAQYDAVCTWGIPDHSLLERLGAIRHPVFVANGDSDPMILPRYSYVLGGLLPNAQVKIYPDSAHGFLFQHHASSPPTWRRFCGVRSVRARTRRTAHAGGNANTFHSWLRRGGTGPSRLTRMLLARRRSPSGSSAPAGRWCCS